MLYINIIILPLAYVVYVLLLSDYAHNFALLWVFPSVRCWAGLLTLRKLDHAIREKRPCNIQIFLKDLLLKKLKVVPLFTG